MAKHTQAQLFFWACINLICDSDSNFIIATITKKMIVHQEKLINYVN